MRKWIVKNAATADTLLAAMEAGTCKTEADVEAIAAATGDTVRWCSSEIDPPTPPVPIPFAFPVTEEDFMDYQEQLAGHKLTDDQRETIAAWVPVINSAYTDGLSDNTMAALDGFIAQHPAGSPVARFLEKAKLWMQRAAAQRTTA